MAIAIAVIVLVLGSVLFHFLSPWNLTPLASNWGSMDSTIQITLWVTGSVFVAVNLFMAYAIIRYRYDQQRRSRYDPENKKLEAWLTGLTTIGIASLLAPGLLVWASFVNVPEDAREFEVVGQQWHWSFRFPGADGRLGAAQARLIGPDNPFGIDPADPRGQDDVLIRSPKVLLPLGQPMKALLRSKDVIHNFQVAQFRVKMDLVPGQVSYLWLTPTRTGEYEILCAELCGVGHFAMRGKVQVVEPAQFEDWLAAQPTFAELAARKPADAVAGQALYAPCMACHGVQGEGNRALNAPRIAGLPAWYVSRQLQRFKSGARGAHPDDAFGQTMRPFATMLAGDAAVADVAAHVQSLTAAPAESTVTGDAALGARSYRTCGACHGANGQGLQALNAPRLAGLPDWYLVTQLQNFQRGIRGRHPDDAYGWQMAEMSKTLIDEQAVRDVVAYIGTLPAVPPIAAGSAPAGEE